MYVSEFLNPDCIHVVSNLLVGLICASSKFIVFIVQETFQEAISLQTAIPGVKKEHTVDTISLNEYRVGFP